MAAQISSEDVVTVDVHGAKYLLQSGHRYLDVRTVEEFNRGHVENALNVPFLLFTPGGRVKNPDFLDQVSSLCSKDDNLVVGCQSGARSLLASAYLLAAEFKNVKNVGGGYAAWLENGFAIQRPNTQM